jgi:hypothetical protein
MGMGELQLDIYAQVTFIPFYNYENESSFLAYSTRIWCENSNG